MLEKARKNTADSRVSGVEASDELLRRLGVAAGHHFVLSSEPLLGEYMSFDKTYVSGRFSLSLCTAGQGRIKVNLQTYTLQAGTVLLISPNQMLEVLEKSDDLRMESVSVLPSLILEFPSPIDFDLLTHARTCPVLQADDDDFARLVEHYRFMASAYARATHAYRMEVVKALFYALMLEVCALYQSRELLPDETRQPRQERLSDEFFRLLGQHCRSERSVGFYAGRMCMTPKYLSTAIKRITGKSVPAWITEAVITQAKILLKTTPLTVAQVSEELNFANPSFFVQYFKQHCGTTPLKYRLSGKE